MKMLVQPRAVVPCLLALSLFVGCSCTPVVDGIVATDTLPAAGVTVRTYLIALPASGDLNLTFTRQDDGEGYAGSVYLFVTPPDCAILTDDPVSIRDGQAFRPKCLVLANSYGDQNCCAGRATLATPARVTKGETVRVFVFGLFQPADLPYTLTFQAGDSQCRSSPMSVVGNQFGPWPSKRIQLASAVLVDGPRTPAADSAGSARLVRRDSAARK
jgi:hypothetical protein